jgi:hypothetical protein
LDRLEPIPNTTLLSAKEAKERLREIVEGFFYRRRDDVGGMPARQLLVRSPPGLGKTNEAMEWATHYQTEQAENPSIGGLSRVDITPAGVWQQVAIFVPRHDLAREVKRVIERNRRNLGEPVEVPILRGRDHEADKGNAPCRRWREARDLGRKGLPVYSNLCRRGHQREVSECPISPSVSISGTGAGRTRPPTLSSSIPTSGSVGRARGLHGGRAGSVATTRITSPGSGIRSTRRMRQLSSAMRTRPPALSSATRLEGTPLGRSLRETWRTNPGGSIGFRRPTGPSPRKGDHGGTGPAGSGQAAGKGTKVGTNRQPRRF